MAYYQSVDGRVMDLNSNPGAGHTRLTIKEGQRLQRLQAQEELRDILKPGDTVCCLLRHCSRSGMRRHISLFAPGTVDITYSAALAMGDKRADDGGIKVDGCGVDMGFALVYNLGRTLFLEGFAVEGCGRNGDTSGHDTDGGYALNHRWL